MRHTYYDHLSHPKTFQRVIWTIQRGFWAKRSRVGLPAQISAPFPGWACWKQLGVTQQEKAVAQVLRLSDTHSLCCCFPAPLSSWDLGAMRLRRQAYERACLHFPKSNLFFFFMPNKWDAWWRRGVWFLQGICLEEDNVQKLLFPFMWRLPWQLNGWSLSDAAARLKKLLNRWCARATWEDAVVAFQQWILVL